MRAASAMLSNVAVTTADKANEATEASSNAAENAQSVAAATEQLGASIREISAQAHRASALVEETTRAASASHADVEALAASSMKIDAITSLISNIAGQTNLLALNATIEAARAGDAGRGFAVVASEVKALSSRTAKASSEIADLVKLIQGSTGSAVGSIEAITTRIGEIDSLIGSVAAAVEEQRAATDEIASNVTRAAECTRDTLGNVISVNEAAAKAKGEADGVARTSESLSGVTQELTHRVDDFLKSISQDLTERRKSVRRRMRQKVTLVIAGTSHEVIALDESLGGIGIEAYEGCMVGQQVTVQLPCGAVKAEVIWSNDQKAGIGFAEALMDFPFNVSALRQAA
jgi:methyl-accepting chemotaxis protein